MIVVDSSTWVSYLRDQQTPSVDALDRLIADDADLAITDLILTELLRGAPSDRHAERLERRLTACRLLDSGGRTIARSAASIHRRARREGITVRSTIDGLIAAVCLRHDAGLLHQDTDFDRLATVVPLRVWAVG